MAYIVNWTKTGTPPNGKPSITLQPLQIDSTSTSVVLTGKGTPNYGEIQQENFIRLLENFASDVAPPNPTFGQIWFNTTQRAVYFYDTDSTWKRIGGLYKQNTAPTGVQTGDMWWDTDDYKLYIYDPSINGWGLVYPIDNDVRVASADEYNDIADIYNYVAATPVAPSGGEQAHGYGMDAIPLVTVNTLTNDLWISLIDKLDAVSMHQTGQSIDIPRRGFTLNQDSSHGIITAIADFNNLKSASNQLVIDRFEVNPASLESMTPTNANHVRTASFYNTKAHEVVFDWGTATKKRSFFNAGGQLKINGVYTPSQSTAFTLAWQSFLTSVFPVIFTVRGASTPVPAGSSAATLSPYDLSTTFKTIFTATATGGAYGAKVVVQARLEGTNSEKIRVRIEYKPDAVSSLYGGASYAGQYTVVGTSTSTITVVKPNELYLNTPEIEYPSNPTQTGTFITDTTI